MRHNAGHSNRKLPLITMIFEKLVKPLKKSKTA
jgi:hypothetical protein